MTPEWMKNRKLIRTNLEDELKPNKKLEKIPLQRG
jgi:hypothetical protein